jgi:hypothetical protein
MIDASHEPFEKNVAITKRVVEAPHAKGISVEAELGMLGGVEEDIKVEEGNACLTNPGRGRASFVKQTGCDSLAAAPSAPATAPSSSRAGSRSTSTCCRRSRLASPASRSSCTAVRQRAEGGGRPHQRRRRQDRPAPWASTQRVPAGRQARRDQDQHRHRRPPRLDARASRVLPRQAEPSSTSARRARSSWTNTPSSSPAATTSSARPASSPTCASRSASKPRDNSLPRKPAGVTPAGFLMPRNRCTSAAESRSVSRPSAGPWRPKPAGAPNSD